MYKNAMLLASTRKISLPLRDCATMGRYPPALANFLGGKSRSPVRFLKLNGFRLQSRRNGNKNEHFRIFLTGCSWSYSRVFQLPVNYDTVSATQPSLYPLFFPACFPVSDSRMHGGSGNQFGLYLCLTGWSRLDSDTGNQQACVFLVIELALLFG